MYLENGALWSGSLRLRIDPSSNHGCFFNQPRPLNVPKVGVVNSLSVGISVGQGFASNFRMLLLLQVDTPDTSDGSKQSRI